MNVVDSSAWLEYFANGPNASFFARPIEQVDCPERGSTQCRDEVAYG